MRRKTTAIIAAARQTKAWPRVETLLAKAAFSRDAAAELSELLRDCGAQDRVADLADRMDGIEYSRNRAERLVDEIPDAYKDVEQVIADASKLVEVVAVLRQVLNVKGE